MKNKYFLICMLAYMFFSVKSFAQKQYDNWFFGENAAISWVSGAPVNVSGGALETTEGCSTMSDSAGNVLLYTDGTYVYNVNNTQMPNGFGLKGNYSASQSAIIVPDPANAKDYYIFTVTDVGGPDGFEYSKVDMTLDGGLGDVSVKNIPLLTPVDEKLTAIGRPDGSYWVIVHALSSNSNWYYAYPLTAAGVGSPVISNVGIINTEYNPWTGYLRVSPDGTKLANALYAYSGVEISDFDINTGIVSNPFVFNSGYRMYGVEFSLTGNVLYAGTVDGPGVLFQLNMRAGDSTAIQNSGTVISTSPYVTGALQMAPDHKIYFAEFNSYGLGVINYPDSLGASCHYVDQGYATDEEVTLGLPNTISGPVQIVAPPVADFQSSKTVICANDCINFTDLSTNATTWQWSFAGADDSTSTVQNPQTVCYATPGTYNVTLIASNAGGNDTVTFADYITVKATPPTPVITQHDDTLYCSTDSSYSSYQWYINNTLIGSATDTFLVISVGGNYNVEVSNKNGCYIAVGINIILGIQNYINDNIISLSPNPASNQLTIHTSSTTNWRGAMVSVMNVLGQEISPPIPLQRESGDATIYIGGLPAGIYFVRITTEKERWVGRFVKK